MSLTLLFLGLVVALAVTSTAQAAPFTSPGTGMNYTMVSLEAAAGGQVSALPAPPACHYRISDNVIISNFDALTIAAGCKLDFDSNRGLIVRGRIIVEGTQAQPVRFNSTAGTPVPGVYDGLTISGFGFAPSSVSNLTADWPAYGVRCSACHDLEVHDLTVNKAGGDGLLIQTGSTNITATNVAVFVWTYMAQSGVAVFGSTHVTGSGITGSGASTTITVWNSSNVTFSGPLAVSGLVRFGAWIDNSTDVTVRGLAATAVPTGALISKSLRVEVSDSLITSPTTTGLLLRNCAGVLLWNVTVSGAGTAGLYGDNVSGSNFGQLNLSAAQYGAALHGSSNVSLVAAASTGGFSAMLVNRSSSIWVNDSVLSGGTGASLSINGSTGVFVHNATVIGGVGGLVATGSGGVTVESSNLAGSSSDGVSVSASSITIGDVTLSNATRDGIRLLGGSNLTMRDSTVTTIGQAAVNLTNSTAVSLANVSVTGASAALRCARAVSVSVNGWVSWNTSTGMSFSNPGNLTLEGLAISSDGVALLVSGFDWAVLGDSALASRTAGGASIGPGQQLTTFALTVTAADFGLLLTAVSNVAMSNISIGGAIATTGLRVSAGGSAALAGIVVHALAGATGIEVVGSPAVSITGALVVGGATGIAFSDANGTALRAVTIEAADLVGIHGSASSGAQVVDATVSNASTGIWLEGCAAASILNATVSDSSAAGILLNRSDGAFLSGAAVVASSGIGVRVERSADVSLTGLTVTGGAVGLSLVDLGPFAASGLVVESSATSVEVTGASAVFTAPRLLNGTTTAVAALTTAFVDVREGVVIPSPSATGLQCAWAQDVAVIELRDTDCAGAPPAAADAGAVRVYWSLVVGTRLDGVPASGVEVSIWDFRAALVGTTLTGANGTTPAEYLLEFETNATGRSYLAPYRANASSSGLAGATIVALDRATLLWIDLLDVEAPHLDAREGLQRVPLNRSFLFQPLPGDGDNVQIVAYAWSFRNETGETLTSSARSFNYTFETPGRYPVTLNVRDLAGNSATASYVVWVNAPPLLVDLPSAAALVAGVGQPFWWVFHATDPDAEDLTNLTLNLTGWPGMALSGFTLSWTAGAPGAYPISMELTDGFDRATYKFVIFAGTDLAGNHPPVFESEPKRDANLSSAYVYNVRTTDPDAGTTVVIQLMEGPEGMSITQAAGSSVALLTWNPSASLVVPAGPFNWTFNVSLLAWDTHAFAFQTFTILLRDPADAPPSIRPIADIAFAPGGVFTIDLRNYVSDDDDNLTTLEWFMLFPDGSGGVRYAADPADALTALVLAPASASEPATVTLSLVVRDSSGLEARRSVNVRVLGGAAGPAPLGSEFPWALIAAGLAGAAVVGVVAARRRGGATAAEQTIVSGTPGFPLFVEGAALFDSSQKALGSVSIPTASIDEVLLLIPAYLQSHPPARNRMVQTSLGGRDVAVLARDDAVLTVVGYFAGDVEHWLHEPMSAAHAQIRARMRESGAKTVEPLAFDPSVMEALRGILPISADASPEEVQAYRKDQALHLASVVELFEGYVRLKVAAENTGKEIAADVRLLVDYDTAVLRLDRTDPWHEVQRERIQLGNVRPGERKTVALYFDPQICMKSFLNATATYNDARGGFHTTTMRTRPVEVVCPAFSTPGEANTAMLRRLLRNELLFRDEKYFQFPQTVSPGEVFEACKRAVQALDIRLVREFKSSRPYQAEAWYYGETKVTKSQFVIWTVVFGQERIAMVAASSNAVSSITGLLAELGRRVVEGVPTKGPGESLVVLRKVEAGVRLIDHITLFADSFGDEPDVVD